jgi:hypothetical protein
MSVTDIISYLTAGENNEKNLSALYIVNGDNFKLQLIFTIPKHPH